MEGLIHLVSESFARHGFDRPLDYRRLHWSRWFPCNSPRSLLFVPSKPGVFALAEEVMDFGSIKTDVETAASAVPRSEASGPEWDRVSHHLIPGDLTPEADSRKPEAARRMLAVLQFCEDDDMAFVLDRMFSRENTMRARLASGRCFVRFVVLEDQSQRRSICSALNQWLISSSEVTTGIGAHFATSLELTHDREGRTLLSADAEDATAHVGADACVRPGSAKTSDSKLDPLPPVPRTPAPLHSGAAANIHCPSPFPSGF
jgi:hypothetical protein